MAALIYRSVNYIKTEGGTMKHKRITVMIFALLAAVWLSEAVHAGEFIEPVKEDKCPVCGMFVYKYPKWVAEIIFKDGTYAAFDGPKDMLKYYFNVPKYNKSKTKEDIAEIYVTEYYTTGKVKAGDVNFVLGSEVYGPMGMELVPVKGKKETETFMKDHKGKRALAFDEIKPADVPGVGKMHHQGKGEMQEHGMQQKN